MTHPTCGNAGLTLMVCHVGMTAYRRFRVLGGTYFFTLHLQQKGADLLLVEIDALRSAYAECLWHRPFETLAITVMPSHLHAIWRLPPGDADFSTRWRRIKAAFSRRVDARGQVTPSMRGKGERGIWQRRFWEHCIRDSADLDKHLRYCWTDPVRHGLVKRAEDWPHSSLRRDMGSGRICAAQIRPVPDGSYGE